MNKTYAKLLIFMAMAAALIGCPPTEEAVKISFSANRIRMRQSEWRRR